MQKIWDCFSFYCEKELLQLRIKHLFPYVDYFVITEANMTHQGNSREFVLPGLLDNELAWAKDKIKPIYLEIDPNNLPDTKYPKSEEKKLGECRNTIGWKIENFQRNAAQKELDYADEQDIIMIGDLDEIPNLRAMLNIRKIVEARELYAFGMINFSYYLNVKIQISGQDSHWPGTVVGKKKYLITPQGWREVRQLVHWNMYLGYHFTWLIKYIDEKITSTAHDEITQLWEKELLIERAKSLQDMCERENYTYQLVDIKTDELFPKAFIDAATDFSDLLI